MDLDHHSHLNRNVKTFVQINRTFGLLFFFFFFYLHAFFSIYIYIYISTNIMKFNLVPLITDVEIM